MIEHDFWNVGVPVFELRTTLVQNLWRKWCSTWLSWSRPEREASAGSLVNPEWLSCGFRDSCGHGPMGIPLDWLMVTTLMVHWFSGTFTWNFFGTQTYGKCHPIQIQWEKTCSIDLLPTVVRVFHTMRVPISPLETNNHLDDSLGSSCRSEPKVYLNNPLVYHTLHPMFSCQLWNHIEMLFIHIYIYIHTLCIYIYI